MRGNLVSSLKQRDSSHRAGCRCRQGDTGRRRSRRQHQTRRHMPRLSTPTLIPPGP